MGILSKFERKAPPTADDPTAIEAAAHLDRDPEEHDTSISGLETSGHGSNGAEMEKQVLRKLDTRLVPLVMGLCRWSKLPCRGELSDNDADLLSYLDRSNIG